jgi:hypothetical protein
MTDEERIAYHNRLRSLATEQERERQRERADVYGYELMTQGELEQYRERVRSAKTEQEQDRIRAEHRKEMEERARERGVKLAGKGAS